MKPLTIAIHLYNAAANQTPIAVFIGKERIGTGTISEVTEDYVKIGEEYFMRMNCVLWVET